MTSSRLADIATIINTQNPDIVALQEVDNRSLGIFNHDYLSELAESTGMHSQFFALVGTYYGIGILSKTEPISVNPVFCPIGYFERQGVPRFSHCRI